MFNRRDKLDVGWLAQVGFFSGFTPEELEQVADLGTRLDVDAGTVLIDQGDYGDRCFVIVAGNAAVSIGGEFVTGVGPGTMVGEMALIEHRPRNATVVAESDLTVVAFDTSRFRTLLDSSPKAAQRVTELLGSRLAANAER